jgi:hypothetical protein
MEISEDDVEISESERIFHSSVREHIVSFHYFN